MSNKEAKVEVDVPAVSLAVPASMDWSNRSELGPLGLDKRCASLLLIPVLDLRSLEDEAAVSAGKCFWRPSFTACADTMEGT